MQFYLKKQLTVAITIYIGQMLVGYGMGWTAPIISKLQDPEETPLPDVISDETASWIGSLIYVGTISAPYITGYFSNIIGRKPCLLMGGTLVVLSFIIVMATSNLAMVFAVRIFNGLGIGIIAVGNLVYIGEIASSNIRGILLTATGIFSTLGTLIIYLVGPYVSYVESGYLGLVMSASYVIGIYFIHESPLYHLLQGRDDKAKETLHALGRKEDAERILTTKYDVIKPNDYSNWKELFTVKSNRKALFITLTLGILQQMSGVVVVIFFATSIFELAGSCIRPYVATIMIGITQLLASSMTPFFVERSGRKTLLLFSTAICSLSLALLGAYFLLHNANHESTKRLGWIPLATLIVFFLSYDVGFGIIPGTFIGEMFKSNVRSSGSAFSVTIAWLVGFGVTTAFGYVVTAFGGHVTFWIFSASCALACLFTVFFVPETKGKSLVEIQEMMSK